MTGSRKDRSVDLPPNEPGVVYIPDPKVGYWRFEWIGETQCAKISRYAGRKLEREWWIPLPAFVKFLLSLLYP